MNNDNDDMQTNHDGWHMLMDDLARQRAYHVIQMPKLDSCTLTPSYIHT